MPDFFWTAFGAALAAHTVAILSVCMFVSYAQGDPKRYAGVRLFDKVLNIGVRGTGILFSLMLFGAVAYVVYLLTLPVLRFFGLWK